MTPAETLAREQARTKREALELALIQQVRAAKLDAGMVREYLPFPDARYRFDLAWPALDPQLCVEVEGGVWTGGRHTRGAGFTKDCEKYNRAALGGWMVIRVTSEHIRSGQALRWISDALRVCA